MNINDKIILLAKHKRDSTNIETIKDFFYDKYSEYYEDMDEEELDNLINLYELETS